MTEKRKLIPAPKWNDHHDWPPPGGLRHLIFHAHSNGFERCVRRVGRVVLIDEAELFKWVDSQTPRLRQKLRKPVLSEDQLREIEAA